MTITNKIVQFLNLCLPVKKMSASLQNVTTVWNHSLDQPLSEYNMAVTEQCYT